MMYEDEVRMLVLQMTEEQRAWATGQVRLLVLPEPSPAFQAGQTTPGQ